VCGGLNRGLIFGSRLNTLTRRSVAVMGSNGVEDGKTPVSLETGENQDSVPPNLTTLCELCKDMSFYFRVVGFGPSYDDSVFGSRDIGQILKESKTCLFCGEIAEFYNKWSRETFGDKVPNLEGAPRRGHRAFFQLQKETLFITRGKFPSNDFFPVVNGPVRNSEAASRLWQFLSTTAISKVQPASPASQ
jgi:hypothetical protein